MTNDNTIDGKKSPALAGQEEMNGGLVFSGKVRDFQPNNQTICDGIFAAAKRPLSTDITTHIPGFAEAINGTMSNDAEQRQFDAMADEFFNGGAAENDKASPTSYDNLPNSFPTFHLPDDLKTIVDAVCKNRNADPAGAWASLLAVSGAALGKTCLGHFGSDTDWGALWWVLNGGPGTNKSPIVKFFIHPLRQYERDAYDRYCADLEQWASVPKKDRGDEPRLKSLVADGITPEKFFMKCCDNGGAIFWAVDEFDGLINSLGQYSKNGSTAEANLKTMYSQEDVSRETISGRPMLIPSPAVTILSTSQPDMIARIMRKYIDQGDGFFDRFLFVPMGTQPPTKDEPPIPDDARRLWQSYVDRLLHNQLAHIYEDETARAVRLEARHKWQVQCVTHEGLAAQNDDSLYYRVASLYPKAHYTICRLSVTIARLRDEDTITDATMRYCVVLTEYLLHQQIKTLYSIAEAHRKPTITKKDVCRWLVDNTDHKKADIARFMFPESKGPRQSLNHHLKG